MDVECPSCGNVGEVRAGTPYPARLKCPECEAIFLEGAA